MTLAGPARSCAGPRAASFEQIQLLLGHASVQTTERYLGSKQKIRHFMNDLSASSPQIEGERLSKPTCSRRGLSDELEGWINRIACGEPIGAGARRR
jgi:hypothetical protein